MTKRKTVTIAVATVVVLTAGTVWAQWVPLRRASGKSQADAGGIVPAGYEAGATKLADFARRRSNSARPSAGKSGKPRREQFERRMNRNDGRLLRPAPGEEERLSRRANQRDGEMAKSGGNGARSTRPVGGPGGGGLAARWIGANGGDLVPGQMGRPERRVMHYSLERPSGRPSSPT